jgi:general secretion pathway protein B
MSYILDALKKSEKERQRGQVPNMLTVQEIVAEKPAMRFQWTYLIVAGLILNAGILITWLVLVDSTKQKAVSVPPEISISSTAPLQEDMDLSRPYETPLQSETREVLTAATEKSHLTEQVSIKNSEKDSISVKDAEIKRKAQKNTPPEIKEIEEIKSPGVFPSLLPERKETVISETADELALLDKNRIYRFRKLPVSIRENLPSFAISALMYSELPASRMVRINDEMMKEGHELASGLKLKEIVNDGVIFRYRDAVSFWVGVK